MALWRLERQCDRNEMRKKNQYGPTSNCAVLFAVTGTSSHAHIKYSEPIRHGDEHVHKWPETPSSTVHTKFRSFASILYGVSQFFCFLSSSHSILLCIIPCLLPNRFEYMFEVLFCSSLLYILKTLILHFDLCVRIWRVIEPFGFGWWWFFFITFYSFEWRSFLFASFGFDRVLRLVFDVFDRRGPWHSNGVGSQFGLWAFVTVHCSLKQIEFNLYGFFADRRQHFHWIILKKNNKEWNRRNSILSY